MTSGRTGCSSVTPTARWRPSSDEHWRARMTERTQYRGSRWVPADRLVLGLWIVPPGKKQPVEIIAQLSDPSSAEYFEFACWGRGRAVVRLHRSERAEVLSKIA